MADWHLYMIRVKSGSLYTGIATDVDRRFAEHEAGGKKGSKYLRARRERGLEAPDAMLNELAREERLDTTLALIELYSAYLTSDYTGAGRSTAVALYLQGRIGE